MPRERWTDDRIDDLAGLVKANDHRLDTTQDMSQSNDRRISDIEADLASARSTTVDNRILWATLASPVISALIFIATLIIVK
jgi:hypothetical protein